LELNSDLNKHFCTIELAWWDPPFLVRAKHNGLRVSKKSIASLVGDFMSSLKWQTSSAQSKNGARDFKWRPNGIECCFYFFRMMDKGQKYHHLKEKKQAILLIQITNNNTDQVGRRRGHHDPSEYPPRSTTKHLHSIHPLADFGAFFGILRIILGTMSCTCPFMKEMLDFSGTGFGGQVLARVSSTAAFTSIGTFVGF
jgi:hypothetical protein